MKQIDIIEDPNAAADVEAELLCTLRESLPQAQNLSLTFAARNADGQLVGGVSGSTSYGWLLIKTLWVRADARLAGLGSRLLTAAEDRGRDIGCHSAWLDTSSPEAMSFYEKRCYRPFGRLANADNQFPPSHRRTFMKKSLLS
ncbi:GNAT family N-acetyltransferase [Agrobacterium cavarae]